MERWVDSVIEGLDTARERASQLAPSGLPIWND